VRGVHEGGGAQPGGSEVAERQLAFQARPQELSPEARTLEDPALEKGMGPQQVAGVERMDVFVLEPLAQQRRLPEALFRQRGIRPALGELDALG